MTQLAKPKDLLDRVAVWCATYLIFAIAASGLAIAAASGRLSLRGVLAVFAAWAAAFVLQLLIRRPRPFEEGKRPLIQMLWETPAFPSAHTAIAAAFPGVFFATGDTTAAIAFAFLAFVMGWARVRVHVHHVSDVLAGGALGFAVAYAIASL